MTDLPLHIIYQEIIPLAYDSLSIDTRRYFGLQPRRLRLDTMEWLDTHLQDRITSGANDDDYVVASSVVDVHASGIHCGISYSRVVIDITFWWDPTTQDLQYGIWKNYINPIGFKMNKYLILHDFAEDVTIYSISGNVLDERERMRVNLPT